MNEPAVIARQRTLLRGLDRLVAERSQLEPALEESFRARMAEGQKEYEDARRALDTRLAADREVLDRELEKTREQVYARFESEQDVASRSLSKTRYNLRTQLEAEGGKLDSEYKDACWSADALLEGAKSAAESERLEAIKRLTERMDRIQASREQARALLKQWKQDIDAFEEEAEEQLAAGEVGPPRKMSEYVKLVRARVEELEGLTSPDLVKGKRLFWLTVLLWLLLILPLGVFTIRFTQMKERDLIHAAVVGAAVSTLTTLVLATAVWPWLHGRVRRLARRAYLPLHRLVIEAEAAREGLLRDYDAAVAERVAEATQTHRAEKQRLEKKYREQRAAFEKRQTGSLSPLEIRYQGQRTASEQRLADELRAAEQKHARGHAALEQQYQERIRQLESRHAQFLGESESGQAQKWRELMTRWENGLKDARQTAAAVNAESDRLFPGWEALAEKPLEASTRVPAFLRFGAYRARFAEDDRGGAALDLTLPALCPFPDASCLLFEAAAEGRGQAVAALQAAMLRLLVSLPPSKVRFLILDPVGLGENFAAFMNLSDHDEKLVVGNRIWTEMGHMEQHLADLMGQMENVIQKYLRNKYPTISAYNAEAGEVAEPFRILVIANFPTNFSDDATRRLLSILQNGPRCGVFTLLSVDTKMPLPRGLTLAELEKLSSTLVWNKGRFTWKDDDCGRYPLTLDPLPATALINRILQRVGEASRQAQKVEVPFEFIAPPPEEWWQGDSRGGLRVPLGRAGATQRQALELGKGTSQHLIVAGKTGSGKSSLMHALITNLALIYSPDEVDLYLIDFKKGVEFKTYAVHNLPHARIVAIESEREFGLSVLQRLDGELKARGERFREVRAQDIKAYRQARPSERAPRVLLIIDEFQEFFTEDDRISQEAAQLLDRLVRQGRAFGMHVLLGSQTLGGAYSLARSTIDQMAVRIALQCSENDAHLILSPDNAAARLLTRPGEAIYNDANGLEEGNHPFQVVWLPDEKREVFLARLAEVQKRRQTHRYPPMIIFEGNAPADIAQNDALNRKLAAVPDPVKIEERVLAQGAEAWLGDALAISGITTVHFRRLNGSNLLMVGQQAEAALGMVATALLGLATQMTPGEAARMNGKPRFYVIDGSQAAAPAAGILPRLPELIPQPMRLAGSRDVSKLLTELSAELEQRQKAGDVEAPALYLVVYGIQRCRDLRRSEDDFGFSKREGPATPSEMLTTLLREGPPLGIHVLIWCDTLNNLNRSLDRQSLREMTVRVAFQMSVADSSNLIDNPQASRLGPHRALLSCEDEGRLEKFRPYGMPPEDWLARVQKHLRALAGAVPSGTR